jgi:hypothetical protein
MYLINRTHHSCERREYAFNILPKYSIITHQTKGEIQCPRKANGKNIVIIALRTKAKNETVLGQL